MGQKVNPVGMRVGINRTWDSRWYAGRHEYGKLLHEDMVIRDHILKQQRQASIAKVVSTETAGRVIDRVVQIFGAMGVAKEMPIERWYRELRIKRIGEGPSEVHRMVLARDLLRG